MPKTDDAKFTQDIFYFKDFGQHTVIKAETIEDLKSNVEEFVTYLNEIGAVPRNTDAPYKPFVAATSTSAQSTPSDPMEVAAKATFGVEKLCPTDGTTMNFKAGGVSRTKVDKFGNPKPFNSRYECPTCQLTVWNKN